MPPLSNLKLGLVSQMSLIGKGRFRLSLGLAGHQSVKLAFAGKRGLRVASDLPLGFKEILFRSSLALASGIDFHLEVSKGKASLKSGLRDKFRIGLLVAAVTTHRIIV
jgi:hypothetical protein